MAPEDRPAWFTALLQGATRTEEVSLPPAASIHAAATSCETANEWERLLRHLCAHAARDPSRRHFEEHITIAHLMAWCESVRRLDKEAVWRAFLDLVFAYGPLWQADASIKGAMQAIVADLRECHAHPKVRCLLAYFAYHLDRYDEAMRYVEEARELDSSIELILQRLTEEVLLFPIHVQRHVWWCCDTAALWERRWPDAQVPNTLFARCVSELAPSALFPALTSLLHTPAFAVAHLARVQDALPTLMTRADLYIEEQALLLRCTERDVVDLALARRHALAAGSAQGITQTSLPDQPRRRILRALKKAPPETEQPARVCLFGPLFMMKQATDVEVAYPTGDTTVPTGRTASI